MLPSDPSKHRVSLTAQQQQQLYLHLQQQQHPSQPNPNPATQQQQQLLHLPLPPHLHDTTSQPQQMAQQQSLDGNLVGGQQHMTSATTNSNPQMGGMAPPPGSSAASQAGAAPPNATSTIPPPPPQPGNPYPPLPNYGALPQQQPQQAQGGPPQQHAQMTLSQAQQRLYRQLQRQQNGNPALPLHNAPNQGGAPPPQYLTTTAQTQPQMNGATDMRMSDLSMMQPMAAAPDMGGIPTSNASFGGSVIMNGGLTSQNATDNLVSIAQMGDIFLSQNGPDVGMSIQQPQPPQHNIANAQLHPSQMNGMITDNYGLAGAAPAVSSQSGVMGGGNINAGVQNPDLSQWNPLDGSVVGGTTLADNSVGGANSFANLANLNNRGMSTFSQPQQQASNLAAAAMLPPPLLQPQPGTQPQQQQHAHHPMGMSGYATIPSANQPLLYTSSQQAPPQQPPQPQQSQQQQQQQTLQSQAVAQQQSVQLQQPSSEQQQRQQLQRQMEADQMLLQAMTQEQADNGLTNTYSRLGSIAAAVDNISGAAANGGGVDTAMLNGGSGSQGGSMAGGMGTNGGGGGTTANSNNGTGANGGNNNANGGGNNSSNGGRGALPPWTVENGRLNMQRLNMEPLMGGRYEAMGRLAEGTFSQTLFVKDLFSGSFCAVKVMNANYEGVGAQEVRRLTELNKLDPEDDCHIVRFLHQFDFQGHFCLVLELLGMSLYKYLDHCKKQGTTVCLHEVRKIALQLMSALNSWQRMHYIHADLKPENILLMHHGNAGVQLQTEQLQNEIAAIVGQRQNSNLTPEQLSDLDRRQQMKCTQRTRLAEQSKSARIKVVDFGNAIHKKETVAYLEHFDVQSLYYRAPEVLLGLPFDEAIDLWSVGCILIELLLGEPLFQCRRKKYLCRVILDVVGPFPIHVYQTAKFYNEYFDSPDYVTHCSNPEPLFLRRLEGVTHRLKDRLNSQWDAKHESFAHFIAGLLDLNPKTRTTVAEAVFHPFFQPLCPFRSLFGEFYNAYKILQKQQREQQEMEKQKQVKLEQWRNGVQSTGLPSPRSNLNGTPALPPPGSVPGSIPGNNATSTTNPNNPTSNNAPNANGGNVAGATTSAMQQMRGYQFSDTMGDGADTLNGALPVMGNDSIFGNANGFRMLGMPPGGGGGNTEFGTMFGMGGNSSQAGGAGPVGGGNGSVSMSMSGSGAMGGGAPSIAGSAPMFDEQMQLPNSNGDTSTSTSINYVQRIPIPQVPGNFKPPLLKQLNNISKTSGMTDPSLFLSNPALSKQLTESAKAEHMRRVQNVYKTQDDMRRKMQCGKSIYDHSNPTKPTNHMQPTYNGNNGMNGNTAPVNNDNPSDYGLFRTDDNLSMAPDCNPNLAMVPVGMDTSENMRALTQPPTNSGTAPPATSVGGTTATATVPALTTTTTTTVNETKTITTTTTTSQNFQGFNLPKFDLGTNGEPQPNELHTPGDGMPMAMPPTQPQLQSQQPTTQIPPSQHSINNDSNNTIPPSIAATVTAAVPTTANVHPSASAVAAAPSIHETDDTASSAANKQRAKKPNKRNMDEEEPPLITKKKQRCQK